MQATETRRGWLERCCQCFTQRGGANVKGSKEGLVTFDSRSYFPEEFVSEVGRTVAVCDESDEEQIQKQEEREEQYRWSQKVALYLLGGRGYKRMEDL